MRFPFFLLLFFFTLLFSLKAAERSILVFAGQRTLVSSYVIYDPTKCTYREAPSVRVMVPPTHGRMEMRDEPRIVQGGKCGWIKGRARNIYYMPEPGFWGMDLIKIKFHMENYEDGDDEDNDYLEEITIFIR